MGDTFERFPLFPLGMVLLPREVVPLHIFEDRYKQMIDECLEGEAKFGMLWMGEAGLHDVGCTAEVSQLLDRMEDGRMNILVQGAEPFRLSRRIDDMPYPAGDIELLGEEDELVEGPGPGAAARQEYADLVERVTDSRPSDKDLEELDSYGMAATIALELDAKQELLELRSEQARLDRLSELLAEAKERYVVSERAASLARTNGHLRN
jgi:Lon protease-like protein